MENDARHPLEPLLSALKPTPARDDVPGAAGDNYPGYFRQHFGYQYDAQELLGPKEREFMARLTTLDADGIDTLFQTQDQLGTFELLVLAHHLLDARDEARALRVLEALLGRSTHHAAIAYDEVYEEVILLQLSQDAITRAREALARGEAALGAGWSRAALLRGAVSWRAGEREEAEQVWRAHIEAAPQDASERAYEIAEWLVEQEERDAAMRFINESKEMARVQGTRATLIDLELLEGRIGGER